MLPAPQVQTKNHVPGTRNIRMLFATKGTKLSGLNAMAPKLQTPFGPCATWQPPHPAFCLEQILNQIQSDSFEFGWWYKQGKETVITQHVK